MKIQRKFQIQQLSFLLIFLAVGAILFSTGQKVNESLRENDRYSFFLKKVFSLDSLLDDYFRYPGEKDRVLTQWREVRGSLSELTKEIENVRPEDAPRFHALAESLRQLELLFATLEGVGEEEHELRKRISTRLSLELLDMANTSARLLEQGRARVRADYEKMFLLAMALLSLMVLSSILISLRIGKGIVRSLARLQSETQRLAEGEWGGPIDLRSADETADLARSFNQMAARRLEVERALRESQRQLRELSARIISVQEDERKRISQEIHDSISSSLTAVKMNLEKTLAGAEGHREIQDTLRLLIRTTGSALDEARRIMTALRPTVLDDLGIVPTLKWFTREMRGLHPQIHIEGEIGVQEEDVPEALKTVIFRVLQEAFNNAVKHGQCEWIGIQLSKNDGVLHFAVEDNGNGFTAGALKTGGIGLGSMRERVDLSGGKFTILSTPGEGTKVVAEWKMPPAGGASFPS